MELHSGSVQRCSCPTVVLFNGCGLQRWSCPTIEPLEKFNGRDGRSVQLRSLLVEKESELSCTGAAKWSSSMMELHGGAAM